MHTFTITYLVWNRTTRRRVRAMSSPVQAHSRWGALRAWWRVQRQWQPLVEVVTIRPVHTPDCLGVIETRHGLEWDFTCPFMA